MGSNPIVSATYLKYKAFSARPSAARGGWTFAIDAEHVVKVQSRDIKMTSGIGRVESEDSILRPDGESALFTRICAKGATGLQSPQSLSV